MFEPYVFAGCAIPIMTNAKTKVDSTKPEELTLNAWAQFGVGIKRLIHKSITY